MSKWEKVNINQIAIQERNAQQEMLSMIEGIKAKAEADGFDVEFFYDEIILTPKKDSK